jgi:hypothetical protein
MPQLSTWPPKWVAFEQVVQPEYFVGSHTIGPFMLFDKFSKECVERRRRMRLGCRAQRCVASSHAATHAKRERLDISLYLENRLIESAEQDRPKLVIEW